MLRLEIVKWREKEVYPKKINKKNKKTKKYKIGICPIRDIFLVNLISRFLTHFPVALNRKFVVECIYW